jgi:hypothetical protein
VNEIGVTADAGQEERYYGGSITVLGRNLVTSLIAGETLVFTRIVVGSGRMPDGVEPMDMTDLVNPIAEATATIPVVENGDLYLTVEYRNDLNGGLKENFWLDEFGIYAKTANSEEILFYYATLGDSPQPVHAYQDNRIDIRRYPVTISLLLDAGVDITFRPGSFITSEEAAILISGMINKAMGHFSSAILVEIIIPKSGWSQKEDAAGYGWYIDVSVPDVTPEYYPQITIHKECLDSAVSACICPASETLTGVVRLWAKSAPAKDIKASAAFLTNGINENGGIAGDYVLPVATADILGGVKIGPGLSVTNDGTLSVDMASDAEVDKILDEVFAQKEQEV